MVTKLRCPSNGDSKFPNSQEFSFLHKTYDERNETDFFLILARKQAGSILSYSPSPKVGVTTSKVQTVRVTETAAFQNQGANKCIYFTENQAKRMENGQ